MKKIGDLTHLHVRVGTQRLVLATLIEFVPPFVATPLISTGILLSGVIKIPELTAVILVFSGQPYPLTGGKKR